jgi:hypothetical protein
MADRKQQERKRLGSGVIFKGKHPVIYFLQVSPTS